MRPRSVLLLACVLLSATSLSQAQSLSVSNLTQGSTAVFRVTGVDPTATAVLLINLDGLGDGTIIAPGLRLGLLSPLTVDKQPVGLNGTVEFLMPLMTNFALKPLASQVVTYRHTQAR